MITVFGKTKFPYYILYNNFIIFVKYIIKYIIYPLIAVKREFHAVTLLAPCLLYRFFETVPDLRWCSHFHRFFVKLGSNNYSCSSYFFDRYGFDDG